MIGKVIYNKLSNAAAVTAIVSTRIYPLRISQIKTFPAIAYMQLTTVPSDTKDAVSGLDKIEVDIDCFSKSYSQVNTLADAVRTAIDQVSGTIEGVSVSNAKFVREFDGYSDEGELFQKTLQFRFVVNR